MKTCMFALLCALAFGQQKDGNGAFYGRVGVVAQAGQNAPAVTTQDKAVTMEEAMAELHKTSDALAKAEATLSRYYAHQADVIVVQTAVILVAACAMLFIVWWAK